MVAEAILMSYPIPTTRAIIATLIIAVFGGFAVVVILGQAISYYTGIVYWTDMFVTTWPQVAFNANAFLAGIGVMAAIDVRFNYFKYRAIGARLARNRTLRGGLNLNGASSGFMG
jgi:hypothetical protein